jgi:Ser/Thr protein kinase RdoA (MazF antagonist)
MIQRCNNCITTVRRSLSCCAYNIVHNSAHTVCDNTLHIQATASLAVTQSETARVQETLAAAGIQTVHNAAVDSNVQWDPDTDIFTSAEMAVDYSAMQSAGALLQQCR